MKKLIAILAIAIVLVGAVFAEPTPKKETQTIYVYAEIEEVTPIFQLRYGTSVSDNGSSTFETGTVFTDAASYAIGADNDRIDVLADLNDGQDIVVSAVVNNAAKAYRLYTLTFKGGVFANVSIGASSYNITPAITTDPTASSTVSTTKGVSAIGETAEGIVTIQFDGTLMENTTAFEIASATYKYDGSVTAATGTNHEWDSAVINPGKYTADIVLEITTT